MHKINKALNRKRFTDLSHYLQLYKLYAAEPKEANEYFRKDVPTSQCQIKRTLLMQRLIIK